MTLGSMIASGGSGIVQAMQGIVAYANPSIMAQVYAGVALVELMGGLTGSFAFAGIFDISLGLTSRWGLGMPFYASAVGVYFWTSLFCLELLSFSCGRSY